MTYHDRSQMSVASELTIIMALLVLGVGTGWLTNAVFSPPPEYLRALENEVGHEKAAQLLFAAEHDISTINTIKKVKDDHDFITAKGQRRTILVSGDNFWLESSKGGYGDFLEGPWQPITVDTEWVKLGLLKTSEPEVEMKVGFEVKADAKPAEGLIELD